MKGNYYIRFFWRVRSVIWTVWTIAGANGHCAVLQGSAAFAWQQRRVRVELQVSQHVTKTATVTLSCLISVTSTKKCQP